MYLNELQNLGFTKEEAKVYLAVLELGGGYVSSVAKKAGAHRVGCYHTLSNLVERGVVNRIMRNGIQYFTVDSPKVLLEKMEEKYRATKNLIPALEALANQFDYKPQVEYFEGREGIRSIFEKTLLSKHEVLGYTNMETFPKIVGEDYLRDYAKRKTQNGVKARMLSMAPISQYARDYLKDYYPEDFRDGRVRLLFVDPNDYLFDYEVNIFGDMVSFISLDPHELMGMTIKSKLFARTQRSVFNLAWIGASKC